ncbi:MAG: VCBS repeat-containing protein [Planctomycetes bacterium]|nr:VCBS repeat-containing protein [Planctomycetota bacterium]
MHTLIRPLLATFVILAFTNTVSAQFFAHSTVPSAQPIDWVTSMAVLDADLDAYPDVVISSSRSGQTAMLINQGASGPGFTATILAGANGDTVLAGDFDGDGDDDIAQSWITSPVITWWFNDGTGTAPYFTSTATTSIASGNVSYLAAIELDGDPQLELVAACTASSTDRFLQIMELDTSGPTPHLQTLLIIPGLPFLDGGLEIADIDDDGDQDIILATTRIFRNDSPSTTTFAFTLITSFTVQYRQDVAAGDLTGDGRTDIAFARTQSGQAQGPDLTTYVGDFSCSPGGFGLGSAVDNFLPTDSQASFVDLADLDGDGRDDAILGYSASMVYRFGVLRSRGDGTFDTVQDLLTTNIPIAAVADFDLDGDLDILGCDRNDAVLHVNETWPNVSEVFTESPSTSNLIWVDQASTSTSPTGSYDDAFPTIAGALSIATPGDAVMVRPGSYDCHDSIATSHTLDGVQLIGVAGPSATRLHGLRFDLLNGARMSGFHLEAIGSAGEAAITILQGDGIVSGNELFGGRPMDGIRVASGQHGYIGSNIVQGFRHGIDVEAGSIAVSAVIQNNTLVDNGIGVNFGPADVIEILNNLIVANTSYGVRYECSGSTSYLGTLTLDFNWVSLNGMGDYETTTPMGTTCGSVSPIRPATDVAIPWNMADFVDASALDFHIVSTSYAVDRGSLTLTRPLWLPIDVDGDPRSVVFGTTPLIGDYVHDIGADEVATGTMRATGDADHFHITVSTPGSGGFAPMVTFGPGALPVSPTKTILLVDPFSLWYIFPLLPGPELTFSVDTVPGLPTLRFYMQTLTWFPPSDFGLTNALVLTYH